MPPPPPPWDTLGTEGWSPSIPCLVFSGGRHPPAHGHYVTWNLMWNKLLRAWDSVFVFSGGHHPPTCGLFGFGMVFGVFK